MIPALAPGQITEVLLVSFNTPGHYSLALPLIKGYAEADPEVRRHINIRVLDIQASGDSDGVQQQLLGQLRDRRTHAVAFSCSIWNAALVSLACRRVKEMFPETLIMLGGQEICPPIDELVCTYPGADILIQGEGEGPFREILKALIQHGWGGLGKVAGIHFPQPDGAWRYTGPAPRILDLASIPSPYLSGNLLPPRDASFGCMIEITRGCPQHCSFCIESERYDSSRSYPLERVEEELRFLLSRGYRRFHFLDPILYHSGRLAALHEVLMRFDLDGTGFFVELYVEHVRREEMQYLSFVTDCDVGLQTVTDEAARIIRRPFLRDRFVEGYRCLKESGMRVNLHLIFGLPGDTFDGFCAGARLALDLQPTCVIFNRLSVLRGTPLRRDAAKYGLRYDPNPPYSVRECDTFPSGDIERARQLRDSISRAFFPRIRYLD